MQIGDPRSTRRFRGRTAAGSLAILLACAAAGPATQATSRPTSAPATDVVRTLDPFPPLPGVHAPRFTAAVDEVRRLAQLGLPDRAYLTTLWQRHATEWQAETAEDDPTIDFLVGVCAGEGIGAPADLAESCRRYGVAVRLGSAPAMVRLGLAYASGSGVERDLSTANLLYRRAADAGDPDGMVCLATAYMTGAGVTPDAAAAIRLFRAAADAGSPVAYTNLSAAYRLGEGVKASPADAVDYMRRALDAGSASAMIVAGDGYAQGLAGFTHDRVTGARWYRKAADLGCPTAMLRLSDLCLSDPPIHTTPDAPTSRPTLAGEPDLVNAVAWLHRAAATGDADALWREGDLFALGLSPLVKVDPQRALADYHRSIDAGGAAAFGRLGYAYQVGWHVDRDVHAARDLYARGADLGDADCMAALAATYDESFRGLDHDAATEAFWYQRAASAGNVAGMIGLATCYLNGTGVARDLPMAARYYVLAVNAGSAAAMNGLGMVYNRAQSQGVGSGRNPAEAIGWFRAAAMRGDAGGMQNLARAYVVGDGVKPNGNQAVAIFQLAVRTFQAQDDRRRAAEVMLDLAKVYIAGRVVPRDMKLGLEWANRAADWGEPAAWTLLGDLSAQGDGVPRDRVAALSAYRKGAAAGDVPAMLAAGALRQDPDGGMLDEQEAFVWYTKAAAAGSTEAMDRLGLLYWKGTQGAHNLPVAADWFTRAADAGSAMGAGHLSEMRAKGLGGPPDMTTAVKYARQAALDHHPEFLTGVADVYLHGWGTNKPDRTSAEILYKMAAALGDPAAGQALAALPPPPPASADGQAAGPSSRPAGSVR